MTRFRWTPWVVLLLATLAAGFVPHGHAHADTDIEHAGGDDCALCVVAHHGQALTAETSPAPEPNTTASSEASTDCRSGHLTQPRATDPCRAPPQAS